MRDGWVETTLGELVMINPEATMGLSPNDEIVYVDLSSVSAESGISADLYRGPFGDAPGRARRVIRSQDVLVSTVRPYLKGFAIVPSFLDGEIASTGFAVLRANPVKVLSGFVWAIVGLNSFVDHLMDRATGSSYPAVRPDDVASFKFELPPLEEQKRIVDVVSSVDAYIDSLQQQADSARTARNAVLHELLSAGGDDWTETTLGKVLSIQSGFAFSTNDWASEGYPVIKINNVRDGKVSTESCSYIADPIPQGAEKFLLQRGDLLITLTGEIGATGTVHQTLPMYLNQRVGKVSVLDETQVHLAFLAVLFNFPPIRAEMWSLGKGNAQLNISPKSIQEIVVNLPPLEHQKWIVEIVSSIDDVIQLTEQAVADAKNLRSGLLSDLLSGEHEIPASYDKFLGAA